MALPTSGDISLNDVNIELFRPSGTNISLNDSIVRSLFGITSGMISLENGRGKMSEIRYVNSVNVTGANIFALMGSPVAPGNYVFENTATISAGANGFALRTGTFPTGSILTIVNKGYIRGKGGNGGAYNVAGTAGGAALYIDYPCSVDNGAGYIYGGGGGGGGFRAAMDTDPGQFLQAGGGGGAGTSAGVVTSGNSTSNGVTTSINVAPAAGTASAGGAGGNIRITIDAGNYSHVYGGNGGSLGAAGSVGYKVNVGAGVGKNVDYVGAAGAAGAAIQRNGLTVTITAGDNTTQIKGAIA